MYEGHRILVESGSQVKNQIKMPRIKKRDRNRRIEQSTVFGNACQVAKEAVRRGQQSTSMVQPMVQVSGCRKSVFARTQNDVPQAQRVTISASDDLMLDIEAIGENTLEVISPDHSRRIVGISGSPFLIGRDDGTGQNHLQLDDPRISRQCAAIISDARGCRIEDRGYRRGIFVNGKRSTVTYW